MSVITATGVAGLSPPCTRASVASLVEMLMDTFPLGAAPKATIKLSVPPASVVTRPDAGVTITTGGSSSTTQSFDGEPEIACSEFHYHRADFGPTVYSVDETPFALSEPNPQGCGFGKVSEVPATTISVPKAWADAYRAASGA